MKSHFFFKFIIIISIFSGTLQNVKSDEGILNCSMTKSNQIILPKPHDAQESMVKFLGAHFQSCAPIFDTSDIPKNVIRNYRGRENELVNSKSCRDRTKDKLNYISFGVDSYNFDAGQLKNHNGKINPYDQFNCSGFVAATMTTGGFKYYKGQNTKFLSPTTAEISEIFKREDTCFFKPEITKKESVIPGDIINLGHGHVIRVLSVGNDPLGLQKVTKKSECKNIKHSNFNFTFAHSTKNIKQVGVIVEKASNPSTTLLEKFAKRLKEFCLENFKDGRIQGKISDKVMGTKSFGFGPIKTEKDRIFSLRRHKTFDKMCTYIPPDLIGDRCITRTCISRVSKNIQ